MKNILYFVVLFALFYTALCQSKGINNAMDFARNACNKSAVHVTYTSGGCTYTCDGTWDGMRHSTEGLECDKIEGGTLFKLVKIGHCDQYGGCSLFWKPKNEE